MATITLTVRIDLYLTLSITVMCPYSSNYDQHIVEVRFLRPALATHTGHLSTIVT